MGRRPTSVLPACWWFPGDLTPETQELRAPEQHTQQTRWAGRCQLPLPPATSRTSLDDGLSVMTRWFCALTSTKCDPWGASCIPSPLPPASRHGFLDTQEADRLLISTRGKEFPSWPERDAQACLCPDPPG